VFFYRSLSLMRTIFFLVVVFESSPNSLSTTHVPFYPLPVLNPVRLTISLVGRCAIRRYLFCFDGGRRTILSTSLFVCVRNSLPTFFVGALRTSVLHFSPVEMFLAGVESDFPMLPRLQLFQISLRAVNKPLYGRLSSRCVGDCRFTDVQTPIDDERNYSPCFRSRQGADRVRFFFPVESAFIP